MRERQGQAARHQRGAGDQDGAPAEPRRQPCCPARRDGSGEVRQEDQADRGGRQAERFPGQPESEIVVDGHEAAHEQERLDVQGQQPGMRAWPASVRRAPRKPAAAAAVNPRARGTRRRNRTAAAVARTETARPRPAIPTVHRPVRRPAGPRGRPRWFRRHSFRGERGVGFVDLFVEVRDRDGRDAAEGHALQHPQPQQHGEAGGQGDQQAQDGGREMPHIIARTRPILSARKDHGSTVRASPTVASEIVSAASAAEPSRSAARMGRTAWVE